MADKQLIHARTAVYNVNYHFVWCVKYRRQVLVGKIDERLKPIFLEIANNKGFTIKSIEVMPDHVHMFASAHPKYAPGYLYKMLKGISGRRLFVEFPELKVQALENDEAHLLFWSSIYRRIVASETLSDGCGVRRRIPETAFSREGCKRFACFSFELPLDIEPKPDLQHPIGIDLGLIDFVYDSDGFSEQAPRYLRRSLDKLARLQRRFAAARKRSPKWYKLLRAIQKRHYKIRCQRNDFLHKLANFLLEKSDLVFHEKLNIKGMSRRPKPVQGENGEYLPNGAAAKAGLNKSISDAGWRQFLLFLGYKAVELGKRAIGVPAHDTSQRCSQCKQIVRKSLSVRTHRCPFCGFVAPRDYNSALEILALGRKSLTASAV